MLPVDGAPPWRNAVQFLVELDSVMRVVSAMRVASGGRLFTQSAAAQNLRSTFCTLSKPAVRIANGLT
jgi:hypothetical protein